MILILSQNDYSNLGHLWAKSLRSIGAECVDLVIQSHRFYPEQSEVAAIGRMIEMCIRAEVVIIMHTSDFIYNHVRYCGKKIIVAHTGTRYRENHIAFNEKFKGIKSISDQSEFSVLGNHEYIVAPVELDAAPFYRTGKLKIGHYPSHPVVKGTAEIIQMLHPMQNKFKWMHSTAPVPHAQQLKRMAGCDVYVELFKPELNGRPYGCFGVTALEAAAMGKIVVTNNLYPDVYTMSYGRCPFLIANTSEEFIGAVDYLLKMKPFTFKKMQFETFEIMKENHSFEATGNKLAKFIYE